MNEPNEGIELLYTRDCTAWPQALANLKAALSELNITEEPRLIALDTREQAETYSFFASPTVHIHGVDADSHGRRTGKRGLGTGRAYFEDGRSLPAPSVTLLKQALLELYET
ncbi:MAG: hypothetical protein Q8P77_01975 [Candidatus Veblenbacteria bacterium]|nr:hypothetical protein [Candidatus Veblenbacteria bacterium]